MRLEKLKSRSLAGGGELDLRFKGLDPNAFYYIRFTNAAAGSAQGAADLSGDFTVSESGMRAAAPNSVPQTEPCS